MFQKILFQKIGGKMKNKDTKTIGKNDCRWHTIGTVLGIIIFIPLGGATPYVYVTDAGTNRFRWSKDLYCICEEPRISDSKKFRIMCDISVYIIS